MKTETWVIVMRTALPRTVWPVLIQVALSKPAASDAAVSLPIFEYGRQWEAMPWSLRPQPDPSVVTAYQVLDRDIAERRKHLLHAIKPL